MAKIFKKPSALRQDYLRQKNKVKRAMLTACIFVLTAILGNVFMRGETLYSVGIILFIISALGFIICCGYAGAKQNTVASLKQGVDGEDITANILKNGLSDKYIVFQNSVITFDGKKSELDLIVVSPSGVFVVEAKNINGKVEGSYTKERWRQHKIGHKGGEYSAEFYSPVKQVATHIFRLAGFLRQNGAPVFVNGIVYFVNEDTELEISGAADRIPVLQGEKNLIRYIKKTENPIPDDIYEKICELLKK